MIRTLAFAGALAALSLATPALAHDEPPPTISVSGTGQVSVAPDMATLRIGVETRAESAAEAVAGNSEAAQRIIDTLKEAGLAAENIQTANFSVSPVYEQSDQQRREGPQIVGYEARNQVVAEVTDLDGLGALLDAAVTSGANRIDGLSFGLQDDTAVTDEARAMAVRDARRKAEIYAGAAGVTLGDVLSISESGGGPVPMYDRRFAMAAEAASVPIERGETTVTANVQMVWEIEQGAQ
ncbi:MAG TPA: SIMPL domain-containing protein [Paracoccaceae bacterium]|nr:SIMPL domain-containing protein [Paracoccaceae bacterium]